MDPAELNIRNGEVSNLDVGVWVGSDQNGNVALPFENVHFDAIRDARIREGE